MWIFFVLFSFLSIVFFASDSLDPMQCWPIIWISYFPQGNNKLIFFLNNLRFRNLNHWLRFRNSENPIFPLIVMNLDFKTSLQKSRMDIFLGNRSNSFQLKINLNFLFVVHKHIFSDCFILYLSYFFLDDCLDRIYIKHLFLP